MVYHRPQMSPSLSPTFKLLSLLMLLFVIGSHQCEAIKWLSLSKKTSTFWNQTRHCLELKKEGTLRKSQVRMCRMNMELMMVLTHATSETVQVCQELFANRRWNCSSINHSPNYMADLTGGSREQAFVYALSSAAVTQAVARACAAGASTKCSCGNLPAEPPVGDFKWGGCGDDIQFGVAFSRMFAEGTPEQNKKVSKKKLVNQHNNAAGRKVSALSLRTACKCHGVSGSCSIKTCWKALPDLRSLGTELMKRYGVAVEVDRRRVGRGSQRKRRLVAVNKYQKHFSEDDLIYYTKSSDYCLRDSSLGSIGTQNRECDKDDLGSGGCRSMCCGRGYTSEVVQIKQRCDCKYYWCCYVKCKTCTKKVEINRCR